MLPKKVKRVMMFFSENILPKVFFAVTWVVLSVSMVIVLVKASSPEFFSPVLTVFCGFVYALFCIFESYIVVKSKNYFLAFSVAFLLSFLVFASFIFSYFIDNIPGDKLMIFIAPPAVLAVVVSIKVWRQALLMLIAHVVLALVFQIFTFVSPFGMTALEFSKTLKPRYAVEAHDSNEDFMKNTRAGLIWRSDGNTIIVSLSDSDNENASVTFTSAFIPITAKGKLIFTKAFNIPRAKFDELIKRSRDLCERSQNTESMYYCEHSQTFVVYTMSNGKMLASYICTPASTCDGYISKLGFYDTYNLSVEYLELLNAKIPYFTIVGGVRISEYNQYIYRMLDIEGELNKLNN